MADDKPKITVIYQDAPKPLGLGRVLLELFALIAAGFLIAVLFGR